MVDGDLKPLTSLSEGQALAMRGLQDILHHPTLFRENMDSVNSDKPLLLYNDSVVLLLPLVHEYITQYIDMLLTSTEASNKSPQSSAKSNSSLDSSLESLATPLNILLQDCATFANNIETQVLAALHVLYQIVVNCQPVQNILLDTQDVSFIGSGGSSGDAIVAMETDVGIKTNFHILLKGHCTH